MNCKPGDMAVVVSAPHTPEMVGSIVIVVRAAVDGDRIEGTVGPLKSKGLFAWLCESQSAKGIATRSTRGVFTYERARFIADCHLRPIRDPGDDAVDETPTSRARSHSMNQWIDPELEMEGFAPPDPERVIHGPSDEELAASKSWMLMLFAGICVCAVCAWAIDVVLKEHPDVVLIGGK